ncbi:MAG: hydrogenase small subunit [Actinobacteria bacterium]|nr:hydrogenase small subunit [Actinomycetota bacterium]
MPGRTVSRRQFLKHASATAALLGLSEALVPQLAKALQELERGKPPVIWIQGQSCTGCSVSFLNSNYPMVAGLVLDEFSVRFQPTLMAAAGYKAIEAIEETARELKGRYVLVVEGPIPTKEGGEYCTFGLEKGTKDLMGHTVPKDKPIYEWMKELVPGAAAVIAQGNCASFGGIPGANAGVTGTTPVMDIVAKIDAKKPVVNVGGCPSHPDWFVGSVLDALMWIKGKKGAPDLDRYKRLKTFFGTLVHENCERRASFDAGLFLEDWNDHSPDMKLCLFKMGCKGPVTYADCPTRRWNSGANWCVGANAPCHGCAEPTFYEGLAPLYEPLPDVNFIGLSPAVDTLGWVSAGATAVGVGAHYLYKQLGKKPESPSEGGDE